jgi:hypothetical protein
MPVSIFPLVLPIVFIVLLIRWAIRGKRAFVRAATIVVAIVAVVALPFYIPGWWPMVHISRVNGAALYQLARWHENHCQSVGALILWPCSPDVEAGYRVLERAAAAGYPPAIYALGVRLKVWRVHSGAARLDWPGRQCFPSATERAATH